MLIWFIRTSPAELEVIKKNIGEWESKREEVASLINQAKTDFHAYIQAIKSGKQLSQLAKIQVSKPPPCPKMHPMPLPVIPSVQVIFFINYSTYCILQIIAI